jgi:hypothetical protein
MQTNHANWCDYQNALDTVKETRAKIYKGWVLDESEYDYYHQCIELINNYNN